MARLMLIAISAMFLCDADVPTAMRLVPERHRSVDPPPRQVPSVSKLVSTERALLFCVGLRFGEPITFGGGELQTDHCCGASRRLGVNYARLGLKAASTRGNHHLVARPPLASGQHTGAMTTDVFCETRFYGG